MSQAITVHDMATLGVKFLRPGGPAFATALPPYRSSLTDVLPPYAVVISNETTEHILAYSICWKCVAPNGKVVMQESTIFDQATLRVLESHSRQLVSSAPNLASWSCDDPQEAPKINRLLAFYQQQESIDVFLDAVILSNGKAIGSDTGFVVPRIKAWVDAERDLTKQAEVAGAIDLKKILTLIRVITYFAYHDMLLWKCKQGDKIAL